MGRAVVNITRTFEVVLDETLDAGKVKDIIAKVVFTKYRMELHDIVHVVMPGIRFDFSVKLNEDLDYVLDLNDMSNVASVEY
jgi:hypothetical protein